MKTITPLQNPMLAQLEAQHSAASAQYAQTTAAVSMLEKVKAELDTLRKLGDMVTPEDVIEGAGNLVGHGAPAAQMAALLSDMPDAGGVAMQGWLAQQEAEVAQKEAQLLPAHEILGHRQAVAGLQLLAGHEMMSKGGGGAASPLSMQSGASAPPLQPDASALNINSPPGGGS